MAMLRESCEVPTCDDPQREKAEDGCKGGIGWQGVADCVPCGRLECAMLGIGRGARLGLRARRRRSCDFLAANYHPRDAKCALGFKCGFKCGPPPVTFSASAPVNRHTK